MIGTIDVEVQAMNPSMPLFPMIAYMNSPSSVRIRNVPKKIGSWQISQVSFSVTYPDNTTKSVECKLIGGVWVGTVGGSTRAGTTSNGYMVSANGTDENGDPVNGYVLGKGDVTILETDGTITPVNPAWYVHLLSEQSSSPKDGDMYPTQNGYVIWQNGQARYLGVTEEQVRAIVNEAVAPKIDASTVEQNYLRLSGETQFVIQTPNLTQGIYLDGVTLRGSIPGVVATTEYVDEALGNIETILETL